MRRILITYWDKNSSFLNLTSNLVLRWNHKHVTRTPKIHPSTPSNNIQIKIGKDCPDEHDEDNCNLQEDNRALYEGPGAELFPARTWRDCYEECM